MNAMAGTVSIALGLKGSMLTVNEQDIAGETAAIRSGDPHHDDAELALLVATFGTAGPLVTGVTHLTGAYGGLGTWRLAAATTTLNVGLLPRLDYLQYPSHSDVRFATQPTPHAPAITLVYGLARGGMQTAMLLSRPRVTGNSHR
jgi:3-oxoacyl-(acyl-carrier-protein) synthase